eukprot:jgi/Psemu1/69088/estExt_Genemark1.C_6970015
MKNDRSAFLAGAGGMVLVLLVLSQQHEACAFSVSSTAWRATSVLFRKQRRGAGDSLLHPNRKNDKVDKPNYFASFRGGSTDSQSETAGGANQPEEPPPTTTTASAAAAEAYYLVWSPGFAKKLALATILFTVMRHLSEWEYVRFFSQHSRLSFSAMVRHSDIVSNLLMPLLSSSCCAIQLLINAVSTLLGAGVGCVGFNSVLGPVRPYLLAGMLVFTNTNSIPSTLGSIATLVLRYGIAFLPEVVFWQNEVLRARWKNRNGSRGVNSNNNEPSVVAATGNDAAAAPQLLRATLVVDVPTMGCVACINKIESSLRQCSPNNIDGATSWLNDEDENNNNLKKNGKKGGRARVEVCAESKEELDSVTQAVIGAIEAAGFGGTTVQSLDIDK